MPKILLVDDNEIERTALREIMKVEPEWELIEAGDGQQALDLLVDGLRPHLCIFDMNMPRMDGAELLQRVRRDPALRQLHVVIATATRDRDTVLALSKLGIDGYLLKPHNSDTTLANLRQVISAIPVATAPVVTSRNLLGKTVLIVEDDLLERTALSGMIKEEPGWEVMEAASGLEALERLRSGLVPDLCLVDLLMPHMDGLSFVRQIRGDVTLNRTRVIILSGEQDRDKILALSKLGISGYLLKPANPAKLRAVLGLPPARPPRPPVVPAPVAPAPASPESTDPAAPAPAPGDTPPAGSAPADAAPAPVPGDTPLADSTSADTAPAAPAPADIAATPAPAPAPTPGVTANPDEPAADSGSKS